MYFVEFPKLGLNFNIDPIAVSIGNFHIYWYGIIISIGFLVAFIYAMFNTRRFNVDQDKFVDCVIVGLISGIIGARVFYVLFYPGDLYIKNPASVFYLNEGGLAIYGGVICGILGGALMARHKKINVRACIDIAAISLLIGQAIGRWGNFVNQEAFGSATNLPWGMVSQNTIVPVHPCFLYESLWCIIGFFLIDWFSRKYRRYDGQMFLMYIIWYGFGRFFIEGLRVDNLLIPVLKVPVSQVIALVCIVVGLIWVLFSYVKSHKESKVSKLVTDLSKPKNQAKNLKSKTGELDDEYLEGIMIEDSELNKIGNKQGLKTENKPAIKKTITKEKAPATKKGKTITKKTLIAEETKKKTLKEKPTSTKKSTSVKKEVKSGNKPATPKTGTKEKAPAIKKGKTTAKKAVGAAEPKKKITKEKPASTKKSTSVKKEVKSGNKTTTPKTITKEKNSATKKGKTTAKKAVGTTETKKKTTKEKTVSNKKPTTKKPTKTVKKAETTQKKNTKKSPNKKQG